MTFPFFKFKAPRDRALFTFGSVIGLSMWNISSSIGGVVNSIFFAIPGITYDLSRSLPIAIISILGTLLLDFYFYRRFKKLDK